MNPAEQKTETWETIDGTQTGVVIGAGEIVNGKLTVPAGTVIENANLRKVAAVAPAAPVVSTTPPQAPSTPANTAQNTNTQQEAK